MEKNNLSIKEVVKTICAGELSKLFTLLYSVGPEKVQGYRQKESEISSNCYFLLFV